MNFELFLSMLINYHHNFRILHWKTKGILFDDYHKICSDYYNDFQDYVDIIAETAISNNEDVVTLKESYDVLEKYSSRDFLIIDSKKDYDVEEINKYSEIMFKDVYEFIVELLEIENIQKNPGVRSRLETICDKVDLNLNYLIKRRIK